VIDRVLPPGFLGPDAREDLTLIFAFLGVLAAVLVPLAFVLIRHYRTRITVRFEEPILENWTPRGGMSAGGRYLTLAGIGRHPIHLVVNVRKPDLVHMLNVACLERRCGFFQRAPRDVVRLTEVEDLSGDPLHGLRGSEADGSVIARYGSGVAKGRRPFALTMVLVATEPWRGRLSVRDETTGRTCRVRLRVVAGDPPPSF
jgi:hypothetical protein